MSGSHVGANMNIYMYVKYVFCVQWQLQWIVTIDLVKNMNELFLIIKLIRIGVNT